MTIQLKQQWQTDPAKTGGMWCALSLIHGRYFANKEPVTSNQASAFIARNPEALYPGGD